MSKDTSPLQPEKEDYDTRFQVVEPGFSKEQDRLHQEAMDFLSQQLNNGQSWKSASESLKMDDKVLKSVVLDDFLKITLAQRNFQGGEGLKSIAKSLKVPMELLVAIKEDMIREVKEASIQAYHLTKSEDK